MYAPHLYEHVITNHLQQISTMLYTFMIIGVIASSISGVIRAVEAKMDVTGAILLAFLTANGGGTVRDIILNSEIFWIRDQFYIWLTFIIGAGTYTFFYFQKHILNHKTLYKILIITDAFGLAAFSIAGVEKAISYGQSNLVVVILGVWTAIGGGILVDIIANRVPLVFSSELYITVSMLGSICYLALYNHINHVLASMIAALIMVIFRLYSVKYKLKFPTISH